MRRIPWTALILAAMGVRVFARSAHPPRFPFLDESAASGMSRSAWNPRTGGA